jgi:tetratricopeptide (TPR) repeat protein
LATKRNQSIQRKKQLNIQETMPIQAPQMTCQESKEIGKKLFKERQYEAAIRPLALAAECFPDKEELWQELILAASWSGQNENALEFVKNAIRHHPRSDWLWRRLGHQLTCCNRLEEAETALRNARSLNPKAEYLWRYYLALHQKRNDLAKQIEAWENLLTLGAANSHDRISLGNAYYEHKNFAKALQSYQLSVAIEPSAAALFNIGLVFNHPEVSQEVDAVDGYRRALLLKPDYERAKGDLEATKHKLTPLAERARNAASGLVQSNEFFKFYISPFEALQIDGLEKVEALDVKTIQRAKKRLLQEIDLNDGKVTWLNDYPLDTSRALAMENELLDEVKLRYHRAVFRNKPLLRFLTRGDIDHFLYSDEYFPSETLELLDTEPAFRVFLSKAFACQYNVVLARAIERRLLPVVEVLFDGRRWVELKDEDVCFEGAYKHIAEVVEATRAKANEGCERRVCLREMEDFLTQYSLPDLFNLLPTAFSSAQRELVAAIRSLAISCFNKHADSDLSKGTLNLCKRFAIRSVELSKCLEEDFNTIERMIAEERKYESRLQFGSDRPFEITKEGVRDGTKFIPVDKVIGLRWGMTVRGYQGAETFEYFFRVNREPTSHYGIFSRDDWIEVSWTTGKASEDKQTKHFSGMVNAALNYLGMAVAEKLDKKLAAGQQIVIGPCTLMRQGIAFQTQGIIFKKDRLIPWGEIATNTRNGQIVLSSTTQNGVSIAMSLRDTENAVLLPIIVAILKQQIKPPPLPNYGN